MSDMNKLVTTLEELASPFASSIKSQFNDELRPRVAMLLIDAATVAARKSAGEDTSTAEIGLAASFANLALRERSIIQLEARNLLINALLRVAGIVAGA